MCGLEMGVRRTTSLPSWLCNRRWRFEELRSENITLRAEVADLKHRLGAELTGFVESSVVGVGSRSWRRSRCGARPLDLLAARKIIPDSGRLKDWATGVGVAGGRWSVLRV